MLWLTPPFLRILPALYRSVGELGGTGSVSSGRGKMFPILSQHRPCLTLALKAYVETAGCHRGVDPSDTLRPGVNLFSSKHSVPRLSNGDSYTACLDVLCVVT